jgi:hypothetical protein
MSAARRLLLSCALLLAGGCATKPPGLPPPATPPRVQGTLIRVNRAAGLVVAECAILPSPGEEARVLRDDRAVGRIRFTPPARFPYMTADVLDGEPMVGDVFEVRTQPAAPPAE